MPDRADTAAAIHAANDTSWADAERVLTALAAFDGTCGSREVLRPLLERPRLVTRIDAAARRCWWHTNDLGQHAVDAVRSGNPGPVAVGLASTHLDGTVRAAAVRRMVEEPLPELMPFLVLRTTDWAWQVRDPARAGLALLLHENPAALLPATASLALWLTDRSRGSFVHNQLRAALLADPTRLGPRLLESADRRVRRFAVAEGVVRRVRDLVTIAETDPDVPVRVRAATLAAREAVWTRQPDLLHRLTRSNLSTVRALAVTGLTRAGQHGDAAAFLDDPAAVVRAVARDAAPKVGLDPMRHYRAVVRSTAPPPGAIDGLAETGSAEDEPALVALLAHPAALARARAVRGLRQLGLGSRDQFVPMLRDESAAVVREATARLLPDAQHVPLDLLRNLLADDRPALRRAGDRLLRRRDGYRSL